MREAVCSDTTRARYSPFTSPASVVGHFTDCAKFMCVASPPVAHYLSWRGHIIAPLWCPDYSVQQSIGPTDLGVA